MSSLLKVIFLDIDGVLCTPKCYATGARGKHAPNAVNEWHNYPFDSACVAHLNDLTEKTGAQLVISSTWRLGAGIVGMREICAAEKVSAPVIGVTPYLRGKTKQLERGLEIQRWLDDYPLEVEHIVILDDDTDMAHLEPYLVRTDWESGLTVADAAVAERILALPLEVVRERVQPR